MQLQSINRQYKCDLQCCIRSWSDSQAPIPKQWRDQESWRASWECTSTRRKRRFSREHGGWCHKCYERTWWNQDSWRATWDCKSTAVALGLKCSYTIITIYSCIYHARWLLLNKCAVFKKLMRLGGKICKNQTKGRTCAMARRCKCHIQQMLRYEFTWHVRHGCRTPGITYHRCGDETIPYLFLSSEQSSINL